jgi:hypothetical protein
MNRRSLLRAGAWLAAATIAGLGLPCRAQPSYTVSLAQLQQVLAQRFPLRWPVGGLLEVEMRPPAIRLLPEANRVAAELPVEAAGPALRRRYAGSVDVDFALRYERSDQSIRAHGIRVDAVRTEGLSRDGARLLDAYLRQLSEQALLEVVLHRLRPQDLALAATMGFEPGAITVTPQGLTVGFVPQRCSGNPAACPCTPASGECVRP